LPKNEGDKMSIKTIPRSEIERLLPYNSALEDIMMEQVEWFSNKSGNLLGTIARGSSVAGWNYAVLNRDGKGDFRVRKVMNNFFNLKAARVDLMLSMIVIEKIDRANRGTGQWSFEFPSQQSAIHQPPPPSL
jgi:hypothetical protein